MSPRSSPIIARRSFSRSEKTPGEGARAGIIPSFSPRTKATLTIGTRDRPASTIYTWSMLGGMSPRRRLSSPVSSMAAYSASGISVSPRISSSCSNMAMTAPCTCACTRAIGNSALASLSCAHVSSVAGTCRSAVRVSRACVKSRTVRPPVKAACRRAICGCTVCRRELRSSPCAKLHPASVR